MSDLMNGYKELIKEQQKASQTLLQLYVSANPMMSKQIDKTKPISRLMKGYSINGVKVSIFSVFSEDIKALSQRSYDPIAIINCLLSTIAVKRLKSVSVNIMRHFLQVKLDYKDHKNFSRGTYKPIKRALQDYTKFTKFPIDDIVVEGKAAKVKNPRKLEIVRDINIRFSIRIFKIEERVGIYTEDEIPLVAVIRNKDFRVGG